MALSDQKRSVSIPIIVEIGERIPLRRHIADKVKPDHLPTVRAAVRRLDYRWAGIQEPLRHGVGSDSARGTSGGSDSERVNDHRAQHA